MCLYNFKTENLITYNEQEHSHDAFWPGVTSNVRAAALIHFNGIHATWPEVPILKFQINN